MISVFAAVRLAESARAGISACSPPTARSCRCCAAPPSCSRRPACTACCCRCAARLEGFSTASLGLMGTAWAGGFVAGCFFAPRLVRRAGHVRAFGAFAASGAIVALLTGLLDRRVCLDRAARLHRLHHGRRLHGHRKLAQREGHQREPRHGVRPLHDGHLRLDHGRPDDRGGGRRRLGVAVHGHRHLLLPVADADRRLDRRPPEAAAGRLARPQGALRQLAGRLPSPAC